jgi:hypothetical protein
MPTRGSWLEASGYLASMGESGSRRVKVTFAGAPRPGFGKSTMKPESLAQRLARLPEASMRLTLLAEELGRLEDTPAAQALDELIRGAVCKRPHCMAVYASLIDARPVRRLLGAGRCLALYAAAAEMPAARLWLAVACFREEEARAEGDRLVHRDLRKLTLGERRALARRAQGETIKKLTIDPDPVVITNLLHNPRTTESTVLAISAQRPTVSPALEAVLASRWGLRYRVRLALCKNPHLRVGLARNLLVCLAGHDLKDIRADGMMRGDVRLVAAELLALAS